MSLKLHHQNLVSGSSSSSLVAVKPIKTYFFNRRVVGLDHLLFNRCYTRKKSRVRLSLPESSELGFICRLPQFRKQSICRLTRMDRLLPRASADDSMTVNGSPQASTGSNVDEMRFKLNQSLQGEDYNAGLVQSLHDSAREFELAIKQHKSFSKISWFSTPWLGVDKAAWVKALSYQASVYSLLQAASEISSRGDGRDGDVIVFVQKSLSQQFAPLENIIKEKLSAKLPEAYEWFWSEQIPVAVTNFVDYLEKDQRFATATETFRKGLSSVSGSPSDISVLMLALSCIAAIARLGPAKVSCAPFFSIVLDITGRLMDMLVEIVPIRQAYHSIKEIGLRREFLVHFGPRVGACRIKNDLGTEEIMFWVDLIQKQLRRAIDREKIWSRVTTCESIEVLEKDLAIFGFFIALGRSTQFYLSVNGFDTVDVPIKGFIRYLIGGSVLYYPQLSYISAYQLYVEVVCEELGWLPFYPGSSSTSKRTPGHKNTEGPPNTEAICLVLDVCSYWIQSFIKYSKWLENPSNVKAAQFLSKGHDQLKMCMQELGIKKTGSGNYLPLEKELDSFDKALGSVEEALLRLEDLLQELHVKSSSSGKDHIKAACSDLERIRRLKKEAEFLEASFRAKAASLQQGDDVSSSTSPISEQHQYSRGQGSKSANMKMDRSSRIRNPHGLWNILAYSPGKASDAGSSTAIENDGGYHEQEIVGKEIVDSESNEIQRFELLRSELIELEKRVQKSTDQYEYDEEEIQTRDNVMRYSNEAKGAQLVQVQKKETVIEKSLDKLKETSTDVWQGTQLLAIDTGAAMGLLRRVLMGDELTEKEKQSLQRTLTDLASVVPIGFLMLLPVTAVGHAAILAAIQRYVPSLIPSTYGPERLDLLRELEKVKEMEDEVNPNESPEQ
ncbi:Ca2+-binding transmembrane LETM1 MRS7 [Olea europaea subsp. europaea]|uniref:Ca2+-binding transmembrane LETM1 MRS7 n=1 Tax=Olea europaea subsp. europaea TaxID=158383 RepID=A0A8S0Q3Q5_OLEEU|nr:Ca2+-binding transmembrane LETM1 MRS7 [Olea europaea subsp. europaea]